MEKHKSTTRGVPREAVLRAADTVQAVADAGRALDDLREAHDGDGVVERHRAIVDLLEVEVDHLPGAAELRVVVLDVARGEGRARA